MNSVKIVLAWIVTGFLGVTALVVLWKMVTDKIPLQYLIAEDDGSASLSRFQFLIFTFVIAMSLLMIVVTGPEPAFPEVPSGVWQLLGISGGSYAVSKGIQKNWESKPEKKSGDKDSGEDKSSGNRT